MGKPKDKLKDDADKAQPYRHFSAWALTVTFELVAALISQRQAWTVVTILFWMGIISLVIGYFPELRARIQGGKLFALEFLRQLVISGVMVCAIYFADKSWDRALQAVDNARPNYLST